MSAFDVVSFDLQGTLTDTSFGEAFWLEFLPREASRYWGVGLAEARAILRKEFSRIGQYDARYYDAEYWLTRLGITSPLTEIWRRERMVPSFRPAMESLVRRLGASHVVILVSSTTRSFIHAELGGREPLFTRIFSTLDDLRMPGKPPAVFAEVARRLGTAAPRCLHVGDDALMDVANARAAGWTAVHWQGDERPLLELLEQPTAIGFSPTQGCL